MPVLASARHGRENCLPHTVHTVEMEGPLVGNLLVLALEMTGDLPPPAADGGVAKAASILPYGLCKGS